MNQILETIKKTGIVPALVVDDAKQAVPLAKALLDGELCCAEIALRTEAAEEAIRQIAGACPEMLLGAGTVLSCEEVDRAVAAGARFIVSPDLNPAVARRCQELGVPVLPGCVTPGDLGRAAELGIEAVKFFPAEACGGLAAIKAMAGPFPGMKFMPMGGINGENLNHYLAYPGVIACGGSWVAPKELTAAGEFEKITALAREAVANMLGFELRHVGLNCADVQEAENAADTFEAMFGFRRKIGNSSIFAGTAVEAMKAPYLGTHGHIAIAANYIDRAVYYLEKRGFSTRPDTAKYKNGKMTAVYLEGEVGGFAIHLVQK